LRGRGLEVHVDALGSMFGLRKGRDMSKAPIGLGSHLDTQPTGGKYDGVLGTLAALEVVRTLNDAGIETETPICICNWTNEEGSRFAPAMMASAAYVGDFTTDDILSRRMPRASRWRRRSTASATAAIARWDAEILRLRRAAHRTGPILEPRTRPSAWSIPARACCGTTARSPVSKAMPARRRCRCGATRWRRCRKSCWRWSDCEESTGRRPSAPSAKPSSPIPRATSFPARSPSRRLPQRGCRHHGRAGQGFARCDRRDRARRKVEVQFDLIWRKPPTHFDPKLVDAVENAAKMLGLSHRRITSGAGHDACNLNTVMPAAMVFVPCKDGISHNELEDATQADCAAGANVLMHTVLALAGVAS
jgi:N-carbamoyl-L-amino-acid hydrolase